MRKVGVLDAAEGDGPLGLGQLVRAQDLKAEQLETGSGDPLTAARLITRNLGRAERTDTA